MRKIWIWFFIFCIGCTNSPIKEEKAQPQDLITLYCKNDRMLLRDSRNNWKVPLDSIRTMDDYFAKCRAQIRSEYANVDVSALPNILDSIQKYRENKDTLDQIFKHVNWHPKVFPYLVIDSVELSLMQLLRPSGGGYFSNSEDILRIYVDDVQSHIREFWVDSVYNYFWDFSPMQVYKSYEWNRLQGPMVNLIVRNENFSNLEFVVKVIIEGYMKAQRSNSMTAFKKELCELDATKLLELKDRYPLRIRLLGQPIHKK
jgi:hypothetical protein